MGIFKRTMKLSMMGGIGVGVLCMIEQREVALFPILFGGIAGFPLGVLAGLVLAFVGARQLVPYRGPTVAIRTVRCLASTIVFWYLTFLMAAGGGIVLGEGPQPGGPSWGWLVLSATAASAVLSPWVLRWYVTRMEPDTS